MIKRYSAEFLSSHSSKDCLELLKLGNERFVNKKMRGNNFEKQIKATVNNQYPFAIVLSCADSRVPVELIFDQGIGDIFCLRVAGNVINDDILASIEYACLNIGVKLVVNLGHTKCAAVKAASTGFKGGKIEGLLNKIKPAFSQLDNNIGSDKTNLFYLAGKKNLELGVNYMLSESSTINDFKKQNKLEIVSAMYNVTNGTVSFFS